MNESGNQTGTTTDFRRADFDSPVPIGSESDLQSLIRDKAVLLVDFYADWCGPCQMLEPTVERIAAETDAAVAKVDIDELQSLAEANNVRGVPTLLLYVDGELEERIVGLRDEMSLFDRVTAHL
jgi:thioredoxin 1